MNYKEDFNIPTTEEEEREYQSFKRGRYTIVVRKTKSPISHSIKGKNIVFTGRGPYTRSRLMQLAKSNGAFATSNSINKFTDILVVGEKPGTKVYKARKENIEIITMEEFLKQIDK